MRRLWMTTLVGVALFAQSHQAWADRATARDLVRQAEIRKVEGESLEALGLYEEAIISDPDYARAYELALPLWLEQGQGARAQSQLERLTLRCPDCYFGWYALGALYRRGERFDLAVLAYDVYLARRPKDSDAVFGLAMALEASDDPRALEALERYLRLETRSERGAYRTHVQSLIDKHRDWPAAITKLRSYIDALRPLAAIVWGQSSAVDGEDRGS